MRRVMIIGGPGSGKSTLARRIGARLGLPVTHLDQLYWNPGWEFRPHAEVADELAGLYETEAWVIEGNYSDTWDHRLARADALIVLDLPTWLRFWRVLRRSATTHGQVRADMAEGCPERFDLDFYRYVLGYRLRRRGRALDLLASAPEGVARYHLRSRAECDRFVAGLPGGGAPA